VPLRSPICPAVSEHTIGSAALPSWLVIERF
jgi:hypothetical protein